MYKYIHTETVITEVRQRPILWDPTHALNKDRDARTLAWTEVYEALYPDYKEMEGAKRKEIGKLIQQRWKTARDAYMRSKKIQKQGLNKKHYGFSEELRFLDKIDQLNQAEADSSNVTPNFVECVYEDPPQDTQNTACVQVKVELQEPDSSKPPVEDPIENGPHGDAFGEQSEDRELVQEPFGLAPLMPEPFKLKCEVQEPISEASTSSKPRHLRKRKLLSSNDSFQREMINIVKENSKLLNNDDLAFCMSLLPIIKDFSVQQKLTFRIETLKIAMEISRTANRQDRSLDSEHSSSE